LGGRYPNPRLSPPSRNTGDDPRLRNRLDEPELGALALRKLRNRLLDNDLLEVPRFLMIREGGFSGEDLVEEEFSWLGYILMNLKLLHAWLLLARARKFFSNPATAPSSPELTSQNAVTIRLWLSPLEFVMITSRWPTPPRLDDRAHVYRASIFDASMAVEL
jgi:hypothetical protein